MLGTNSLSVLLKAIEGRSGRDAAAIRTNAAMLLSQRENAQILLPIAKNNPDPEVRMWAFSGITDQTKLVILARIAGLQAKDSRVRQAAIMGLGGVGKEMMPEVLPALVKCLQDEDPDVRREAATDLCFFQENLNLQNDNVAQAAFVEINKALNNPNPDISKAAAKALKELHPQFVLVTFAHELAISQTEPHGKKWTVTLKVVDEKGNPLADAKVGVGYYVHSEPTSTNGITGKNGIFEASRTVGPSLSGYWLSFSAEKDGYDTARSELNLDSQYDSIKWNPTITLVLKGSAIR